VAGGGWYTKCLRLAAAVTFGQQRSTKVAKKKHFLFRNYNLDLDLDLDNLYLDLGLDLDNLDLSGIMLVQVGSLDVKLDLICEAAECIDPEGPIMVGTDLPQEQDNSYVKPIIAAIPLMMLVLGALVCGVMMARVLPYLKPRGKGAKGAAGEATGPRIWIAMATLKLLHIVRLIETTYTSIRAQ
jgi:hypothetical protein